MGTLRTRFPFPSRSTSTHRPSRCWIRSAVNSREFAAPQAAADQQRQQRAIPLRPQAVARRRPQQRVGLVESQPDAQARAFLPSSFDAG